MPFGIIRQLSSQSDESPSAFSSHQAWCAKLNRRWSRPTERAPLDATAPPLAAQAPLHQSPPPRRRSSVVERQLPKLHVVGSIPVAKPRKSVESFASSSKASTLLRWFIEKELGIARDVGCCQDKCISSRWKLNAAMPSPPQKPIHYSAHRLNDVVVVVHHFWHHTTQSKCAILWQKLPGSACVKGRI